MEGGRAILSDMNPFRRRPEREGPVEALPEPGELQPLAADRRTAWTWIAASILVGLLAGAVSVWMPVARGGESMTPVAQQQVAGIQLEVSTPEGNFTSGSNRFRISFRTADGEPLEINNVQVEFFMPAMGTMPAMQEGAQIEPGDSGDMSGQVNLSMAGEWQMRIAFETAQGPQNARINIRTE
ncbi:MAG: FixH family protein [Acidobacteriota bacterium]